MNNRPICRIRIERWGSTVVMQVLEQSEDLRKVSTKQPTRWHTDHIASNVMPALRTDRIHIRGVDKDDDNKVASLTLEDAKTADEHIAKVRGWFDEWRTKLGLEQENPNPLEVLDEVRRALGAVEWGGCNAVMQANRALGTLRAKYTPKPSQENIIEL